MSAAKQDPREASLRVRRSNARSVADAIKLIVDADWPPQAVTMRVLDPYGREVHSATRGDVTLAPLLAVSVLAALYLLVVGVGGANVGLLLWPAFAAILAGLLAHEGRIVALRRGGRSCRRSAQLWMTFLPSGGRATASGIGSRRKRRRGRPRSAGRLAGERLARRWTTAPLCSEPSNSGRRP